MTITNSTLSNNSSGVLRWSDRQLGRHADMIADSTISGNSAARDGGAIENYYATLELTNSTISGNSAGRSGGAIDNWADGESHQLHDHRKPG